MVVSTVDPDGAPSSRTVLCKGADDDGFVFFTNYAPARACALAGEPRVSLLFPWHLLARQVIVIGVASPVSRAESEAYFATRSRGAQLSASASEQSPWSRAAPRSSGGSSELRRSTTVATCRARRTGVATGSADDDRVLAGPPRPAA